MRGKGEGEGIGEGGGERVVGVVWEGERVGMGRGRVEEV